MDEKEKDDPVVFSWTESGTGKEMKLRESDWEMISHTIDEQREQEADMKRFRKGVLSSWNHFHFLHHSSEQELEHFLEEIKEVVSNFQKLEEAKRKLEAELE